MNISTHEIGHLPKVELHLHLDCSLSYEVVKKLGLDLTLEQFKEQFIAPGKCPSLNTYLDKASSGIKLMQTKRQLELVTRDIYNQLKSDKVIYAEIRFAPLLHTEGGLEVEDVVKIVTETAIQCQKDYEIPGGIILCTLRHFNKEQGLTTVKLVEKFIGKGVVGFDIASDEAGYPIDSHLPAFEYANEKEIPCTAHAGEAKGAESVWETLHNFCPQRIGHGVRSEEDDSLLDYLMNQNIHLEVCPTSNIQTNIFSDISHHNVDRLYNKGLSLSINTDGRTISNTSCTLEYKKLVETFEWTKAHFLKCNLEAIDAAFTFDKIKSAIKEKLLIAYANAEI